MCPPLIVLAVATAAVAIGKSVASYEGQQKAFADNRTAANLTYANTTNTLNQKAAQIDAQHSEDVFDNTVKAAQDSSQIAASASSSGLAPTSLLHSLNAADFANSRDATLQDINTQNELSQVGNEQYGAAIKRQSDINSVAKPSSLSLGLGIADGVLQGANTYVKGGGKS